MMTRTVGGLRAANVLQTGASVSAEMGKGSSKEHILENDKNLDASWMELVINGFSASCQNVATRPLCGGMVGQGSIVSVAVRQYGSGELV